MGHFGGFVQYIFILGYFGAIAQIVLVKLIEQFSFVNDKQVFIKDAGFVYESLRIKTNRVIWDFCLHETNPRNESFKNESTKQIHDTNL